MTTIPVENNSPIVTLVATGGQTTFDFGFLIQTAAQLQIVRTPTGGGTPVTLVLDVDFTVPVAAIGTNGGGTITLTASSFPTGATAGDLFTISREIPITRASAFPFRGIFNAETINFQLDTIFLILQEQERDVSRAFTLNIADSLTSIELPLEADRAGNFLAFGDLASGAPPIASPGPLSGPPVSTFGETLIDDADATAAQATLNLSVAQRAFDTTLHSQVFC